MIIDEIQMWAASELGLSAEQYASFSLRQVDESQSYILESVVGLDPNQIASLFYGSFTESTTNTKELYFNMMLPPREIGMKIKLNPQIQSNETYSGLREHLYRIIARSRTGLIELRFLYNSVTVAVIQGRVSRLESNLFDTDPKVQLTLRCDDPMLKGPSYISAALDELTWPETIGYVISDDYSTAPHGFKMELTVGSYGVNELTIKTITGYDNLEFQVDKAFSPGDVISFSSEENNKYLYFTRGSTVTHIVDKIAEGSVWPILFPGDNSFEVYAPSDEELFGYTVTIAELTYKPHYWGV